MRYWLFKSEPNTFSIDDLQACPHSIDHWDGVRNYQARNMMRDDMKPGDLAFFYHSNCKPPGIVGIVEIVKAGYPDFTAQDPDSNYYDPKATADNPIWHMVDVQFKEKFDRMITLDELKEMPDLGDFPLTRRGNRLSIMPVEKKTWKQILRHL